MNNLLTFPNDMYLPNADYDTNLKQFQLAVDTLVNNEFITKDEYFDIVGHNFGILYDAYYNLNTQDKLKLELSDLKVWNDLYVKAHKSYGAYSDMYV